MNNLFSLSSTIVLLTILLACSSQNAELSSISSLEADESKEVNLLFGLNSDSFVVVHDMIKSNQFLADILLEYKVPYSTIHQLGEKANKIFDVRQLQRGKPYTLFCSMDSSQQAQCLVYQPNEKEYVVFDLRGDSVDVRLEQKPVEILERSISGTIQTSLYKCLENSREDIALAFHLASIYAWTIDFYRLQRGDQFRVLFDEARIEGKSIGIQNVKAAVFYRQGHELFAYYFEQEGKAGEYFDEEGQSLRKVFLKSPLKFSRLTSGYSRSRLHPVQKVWKSHLGTDYAAPTGTPILSTGDGTVAEAGFKRNNGNYVKIRHNNSYTTMYLHMSKIEKGMKRGTSVKQGEVIGYVGSTGLATGPHVCYRFWKEGKQVNHLLEEFPPAEPVEEKNQEAFLQFKELLKKRLLPASTTS